MEINKLRYNLYDYFISNNTKYILTNNSINFYKLFLIFIYLLFILIIIFDYNKINFISLFFIFIYTLFIYFILLFDTKINNIIDNDYFKKYIKYYKLFNTIFIDSYNSNNISVYVKSFDNNLNDLLETINIYKKINIDEYEISFIYNIVDINKNIIRKRLPNIRNFYSDDYLQLFINKNNNIYIIIDINNDNNKNIFINNINNFSNLYSQQKLDNDIIIYDNIYSSKNIINLNSFLLKYKNSNHLREINDNLIKYLKNTDVYINFINNNFKNNYINIFYNTITKIYTNIKYNDNIIDDKLYDFANELMKNNDLLKYIDIYNNELYNLKKYIFIKIDNTNDLHIFIHNNYEINKNKYLSLIDDKKIKILDVILNISNLYNDNNNYYLIDIETINNYLNKKDINNININSYISEIYDKLLYYYNSKLSIGLENFDILYIKNNVVDEKILEQINIFNNYFINLIIIIIIFLTINLHIFYIKYYKNLINIF